LNTREYGSVKADSMHRQQQWQTPVPSNSFSFLYDYLALPINNNKLLIRIQ